MHGALSIFLALAVLAATSAPAGAALFTHPPTDIGNVAGIVPLGNVSPASGHVLPVNHMYLRYPVTGTGADSYPVYAMGAGRIVMVTRRRHATTPDSYQIYVRHNRYVTSHVDYVYRLPARIRDHLASTRAGWLDVAGPDFRVMVLGSAGAPPRLPVDAGEVLGLTYNHHESWDVGVIDSRVRGALLGRGRRRYPRVRHYLDLLGYLDVPQPFRGQETRNAASFIRYLAPELKAAWFGQLLSEPRRHGRTGWDVDGRLRGAWFNPAVDAAPEEVIFDLESAAVSVTPHNRSPRTKVQIAIAQGLPLAALDPTGAHPELAGPIVVDMDRSRGARVNPDPARVGPGTGTVCYDVPHDDGGGTRYGSLLFRMLGRSRVAIRFDPTPHLAPDCANRIGDAPDGSWVVYRR